MALNNTPLINGTNYAWANVALILFGVPVVGITKIEYKKKANKANNYGAGQEPVSRGYGNNEYEASIEIYQDEWRKIIALSPVKDPTQIPPFEVQVVFGGSRLTTQTDILQMAEFPEDAFTAGQGDTKLLINIPLIIGGILHL